MSEAGQFLKALEEILSNRSISTKEAGKALSEASNHNMICTACVLFNSRRKGTRKQETLYWALHYCPR